MCWIFIRYNNHTSTPTTEMRPAKFFNILIPPAFVAMIVFSGWVIDDLMFSNVIKDIFGIYNIITFFLLLIAFGVYVVIESCCSNSYTSTTWVGIGILCVIGSGVLSIILNGVISEVLGITVHIFTNLMIGSGSALIGTLIAEYIPVDEKHELSVGMLMSNMVYMSLCVGLGNYIKLIDYPLIQIVFMTGVGFLSAWSQCMEMVPETCCVPVNNGETDGLVNDSEKESGKGDV